MSLNRTLQNRTLQINLPSEDSPFGMIHTTLELFFLIHVKLYDFSWYFLVCFEILYQLAVVYPQGGPFGTLLRLKNQLFVKFKLLVFNHNNYFRSYKGSLMIPPRGLRTDFVKKWNHFLTE